MERGDSDLEDWRTGKLRLLLQYREIGGARKGKGLPGRFGAPARGNQQGLAPGRSSL